MTTYQTHAVLLKPAQKELLLKAVNERTGAIIRLPQYAIQDPYLGSDPAENDSISGEGIAGGVRLPLNSHQVKRFTKNTKLSRGVDLHLSKSQVNHIRKSGVGQLMGIEGGSYIGKSAKQAIHHVGRAGKAVAHHIAPIAKAGATALKPIVMDLAKKQIEKKIKEQFGGGQQKKKPPHYPIVN